MPFTARLMSRGMSDPPAVTTRSRGALNTGDGGLCRGCGGAACTSASGGRGVDAASPASAMADSVGATKRKITHRQPAKKGNPLLAFPEAANPKSKPTRS